MSKSDSYQYNMQEGDIVEYKGKEYVVVSIFIDMGGNVLRAFIVRTGGCVKLRWAKEFWDEEVNELKVIRSWGDVPKCG